MPRRSSKKTPARRRAKSHKKRSYRASRRAHLTALPGDECETILKKIARITPAEALSSLEPEEQAFVQSLLLQPSGPVEQEPPEQEPPGPVEQEPIYDIPGGPYCPQCLRNGLRTRLGMYPSLNPQPGQVANVCPQCDWTYHHP